ncbi:MAG: cytochrome c oxidase assembly protein [Sulfitobacter sp.]
MAMSGPKKTVIQTVSLVVVMGGLAWASVPFYDWFCRVTGFGGVPQQVAASGTEILDQTIKIRFDGTVNSGLAWEFKPVVREIELRIGETALAFYEAHNPTSRPIAGQASYNVTPYAAGAFFDKIDCFCFTEQVLAPGETVQMPVSFFVDPEIVKDNDGKFVHTITLSYTFYEIDLPEGYAALAQEKTRDLN